MKNIKHLPILKYLSEINTIDKIKDIEEWIQNHYLGSLNIKERRGLIIFKDNKSIENSRKYILENEWKENSLNVFITPNGCIIDFNII